MKSLFFLWISLLGAAATSVEQQQHWRILLNKKRHKLGSSSFVSAQKLVSAYVDKHNHNRWLEDYGETDDYSVPCLDEADLETGECTIQDYCDAIAAFAEAFGVTLDLKCTGTYEKEWLVEITYPEECYYTSLDYEDNYDETLFEPDNNDLCYLWTLTQANFGATVKSLSETYSITRPDDVAGNSVSLTYSNIIECASDDDEEGVCADPTECPETIINDHETCAGCIDCGFEDEEGYPFLALDCSNLDPAFVEPCTEAGPGFESVFLPYLRSKGNTPPAKGKGGGMSMSGKGKGGAMMSAKGKGGSMMGGSMMYAKGKGGSMMGGSMMSTKGKGGSMDMAMMKMMGKGGSMVSYKGKGGSMMSYKGKGGSMMSYKGKGGGGSMMEMSKGATMKKLMMMMSSYKGKGV